MILLGSLINGGAIVAGGLIGMLIGKLLPERLRKALTLGRILFLLLFPRVQIFPQRFDGQHHQRDVQPGCGQEKQNIQKYDRVQN